MKTTLTGRKRKLQIKTNKKNSTQKPSKNSPYTLHMTRGFFSDAAYRATFIYTDTFFVLGDDGWHGRNGMWTVFYTEAVTVRMLHTPFFVCWVTD